MKRFTFAAGRVKAVKAASVCLLVAAITALMFSAVVRRQPLERDRLLRAQEYEQSRAELARIKADNARRAADGMSSLDTLIDAFAGADIASKRQTILTIKEELERMTPGTAQWEAKSRELEALEREVGEYDREMKKLREQLRELK
jgi:hypothetical protein